MGDKRFPQPGYTGRPISQDSESRGGVKPQACTLHGLTQTVLEQCVMLGGAGWCRQDPVPSTVQQVGTLLRLAHGGEKGRHACVEYWWLCLPPAMRTRVSQFQDVPKARMTTPSLSPTWGSLQHSIPSALGLDPLLIQQAGHIDSSPPCIQI